MPKAIVVAGTSSGCGKTSVALGLMKALARRGLTVQGFKSGPDFIDPGLHRMATNQLINGLCQGAIYALMAIGYSVVVGVVGMVTFTHDEVIMIGAFASFYAFEMLGNNLLIGAAAAFAVSWLIGMFVYKVCYERFLQRDRKSIV